jgi:hypothetical protein
LQGRLRLGQSASIDEKVGRQSLRTNTTAGRAATETGSANPQ